MTTTPLQPVSFPGFALTCGLLLLASATACSSGPDYPEYDLSGDIPRRYQAPYSQDSPVIDGSMDDVAWREASWTANFIKINGSRFSLPRHQSRAKMMWDEQYLYVGVWMVEPALKSMPISTLGFDGLMLFVSGDVESGAYHLISIEPGGRVSNSAFNAGEEASPISGITGMQHGVALSGTLNVAGDGDKGWWAEFAITWSSLTSDNQATIQKAGAEWRINLVREEQAWSPYFNHELHDSELWGKVELVR